MLCFFERIQLCVNSSSKTGLYLDTVDPHLASIGSALAYKGLYHKRPSMM